MWSKLLSMIALWFLGLFNYKPHQIITPKANIVYREITEMPIATPTILPTGRPTSPPTGGPTIVVKATKIADTAPWGIAQQIDEVTWTMKIEMDAKMGTPEEILSALNEYRRVHGSGPVAMDDKLMKFALERAKYFTSIENVDKHKGFEEKLKDEQGFRNLGFWSLGENASYGYRLEGVHLIEWMYASDEGHNKNQLEPRWTHVGIGVDGVSNAIIFAKDKI